MLTANTPAPKTRAEAWAAFEAAIIQKHGLETIKRLSPHHVKFNRMLEKHYRLFLFAEELSPNRGEVLMNCIDGGTMRINIMVKHQRLNIDPNVVRIASHFPELRARQDREIAQGRAPSWERIMGWLAPIVRFKTITGNGLMVMPLAHTVHDTRVVAELIDGELHLMPIFEEATYYVAMTTKVSHLAYEGKLYEVVAVVAKNHEDLQKYEDQNIGFFKTM